MLKTKKSVRYIIFVNSSKKEYAKMIKGNAIVGQSGGPTAVINSSLAGVFKTARDNGIQKFYGMKNGLSGFIKEEFVDLTQHIKSGLDIELLKRTPSSFLGSCRYKLPDYSADSSVYEKIFSILKKYDIKYFFYIGGNDSMDSVAKLSAYAEEIGSDIRFMGVPKTIDNDLDKTDHTPGFGSASKYIASVVKEIILDNRVYGTEGVAVVETMGRNAGWLAAASALAKTDDCEGPDLLCLPEVAFDYNWFYNRVNEIRKDKKSMVIVVSEGIKTASGNYLCEENNEKRVRDAFGHASLGGTAMFLTHFLRTEMGIKTRENILGSQQRSASHIVSRTDITEAFVAGGSAVQAALEGKSGKMITFRRLSDDPYKIDVSLCNASEVANVEKKIPDEWIDRKNGFVSQECINYIKPLIIGELSPFMVDGMPMHMHL